MIWLASTAVFWVWVMVNHCADERDCRGYRDVEAERHDIEDAACAWALMWVLTGWGPFIAWAIIG